MKIISKIIPLFLISFCALAGNPNIQVNQAWIKQLPPVVAMRAGYLELENNSSGSKTLVSITSRHFSRIEIHKTENINGVMKMSELHQLEIPAHQKVTMQPGGIHLMMFDPDKQVKSGQQVTITLFFKKQQLNLSMLVKH